VAVPIGDELRASLAQYVAELRKAPWADAWRWTDPASWHVTLAFLGSISPASVPDIAAKLEEVAARRSAFTVSTGGLGAFPSMREPRVLWYGVDDPSGDLERLADNVRFALSVHKTSPFQAHITLGRLPRRFKRPRASLQSARTLPMQRVKLTGVTLFRSHQCGDSTHYRVLWRTQLRENG
jgi:2'-5' RNA ligase